MKAKKENKYLVFKLEDLENYFSQKTYCMLKSLECDEEDCIFQKILKNK